MIFWGIVINYYNNPLFAIMRGNEKMKEMERVGDDIKRVKRLLPYNRI